MTFGTSSVSGCQAARSRVCWCNVQETSNALGKGKPKPYGSIPSKGVSHP